MAHLEDYRGGRARGFAPPLLSRRSLSRLPGAGAWLPSLLVVAFLAAWETAAQSGFIKAMFFPPPSTIAATLAGQVGNGDLLGSLGITLQRLLLGMIVGGVPGLLLGQLLGWSPRTRSAISPFIAAAHPIPKIAVLPLIMVVFGVGETSLVVVAATGAFFPMLINTMVGVQQINPIHFEVARNYGASPWKVFARVILPGSLPFMLAGLLLALNVTLLLTIAVEMVSASTGLGAAIWLAWQTMHVDDIYANLVVITVFGVGFNLLIQYLRRRLIPWQVDK